MRYILVILLFVSAFMYTSCEQESTVLGRELISANTTVVYTDSVTVSTSTVLLDSVSTSAQNVIFCGNINDGEFGAIKATSFFQLGIPAATELDYHYQFDSITLNMKSNGFVYGDTTQTYNISVHRLTEEITDTKGGLYYNINPGFAYDPVSLGSRNFKPRPHQRPNFSIRLSDDLGNALYKKLDYPDDSINIQTTFLKYFKGLAIMSSNSNSNSLVLGFKAYDSTAYVRLYYRLKSADKNTNLYVDFALYNSAKQFNRVVSDRTGTTLNAISSKNQEIPSVNANNLAYLQSTLGLGIKFSFPYLKNLLGVSQYYSIVKAELIVKPVIATYSRAFALPSQLALYQSDGSYSFGSPIYTTSGGINYGNLYTDYTNPENTVYSYNITSYIVKLLATEDINHLGLLCFSPTYQSSMERLIIGNQLNYKNKTYLRLFYIRYNE